MATVLLIDDSHLGRTHAELALRGTGHELIVARDGVEALALISSRRPDCVVLNRHTPALGAEALLERIRVHGRAPRVIVRGVALTENTVSGYRARGVDVVLNGPHTNEERALVEAIRVCTEKTPYSNAG